MITWNRCLWRRPRRFPLHVHVAGVMAPASLVAAAAVAAAAAGAGSAATDYQSEAAWLECNSSLPCVAFDFNETDFSSNLDGDNATEAVNATGGPPAEDLSQALVMGATSVILGLIILITVIGNVFVIAAILLERNLQNVANYLIVSLAVADLMVACLVMPLGAVYEISKGWILGPELCDMWTSSDVLCCTASILHLVAIAVDRYWAVTNVDYIHTRNSSRIGAMIVVVWAVALIVSLAPQFGWKDPEYLDRINLQQRCLVSQDIAYQVFATCSTFYVPLLVILVLYWKIFQTARKRIHRRRHQKRPVAAKQTGGGAASRNGPSAGCVGGSASATRLFLSKRRFPRRKSAGKKAAAEAFVSSVVLVEGQSTPSVDALGVDDDTTNASSDNGIADSNEEYARAAKVVTTVFSISKSVEQTGNVGVRLLEGGDGVAVAVLSTSNNVSPEKSSTPTTTNNGSASHQSHMSDMSRVEMLHKETVVQRDSNVGTGLEKSMTTMHRKDKKESLEAKRERKAAKTLAIITGAFVVCWLPFFIMALLLPLCESCHISDSLQSFFLWMGYFNSTLNPVIYTIFSPEFRQAFKRILCGSGRRTRSSGRKIN